VAQRPRRPGRRGLHTPEFLITDGAAGLERALAALWPDVPAQRCAVHKHRNLLAHAPDALHEEVTADYTNMIYAETPKAVQDRRRAFLRKWRLRCPGVATSLEEAGDRLFTFLRLPPGRSDDRLCCFRLQRRDRGHHWADHSRCRRDHGAQTDTIRCA